MITDELRDWAKQNQSHSEMFGGLPPKHPFNRCCKVEDLLAIADRIDAAHQKDKDEWKAKDGQSWLNGYAECRAELMEGNEAISASLEEVGWVKLPVDADGVPIRVGDMMWQRDRITKRACKAIMGGEYVMLDGIQGAVYAKGLTHYHAPTTEDVLREFAERVCNSGHQWGLDADTTIAEYAKRLQLKEVDE